MNFLLVYLCRFAVRAPLTIFSNFSRQCRFSDFTTFFVPHQQNPSRRAYFTTRQDPCLRRAFPSARFTYLPVSLLHFSDHRWFRIINRMFITYVFRPLLSPRLTLGGRTFPRKPQTLDGGVSRSSLATYAGILSCISSISTSVLTSAFHTLLLYRCNYLHPHASVSGFSPVNLRRTFTRPVSYYALF